jgi:Raf kinase inhibitor-like YbhB/YbcL family protein
MTRIRATVCLAVLFGLLCWMPAGCSQGADTAATDSLELKSSSFNGGAIPGKYSSCKGQGDISPELSWGAPPEGTLSFALIAFDRDSPFGFKFTHWVLYDIAPEKRELSENVLKEAQLPDGSRQGPNDYERIGYVGPCPPRGIHHYVFTIYALDSKLNVPPGASQKQVLKAMKGHILAKGELVGSFQH